MHKNGLKKTIIDLLNVTEMHGYAIQKQLIEKGIQLHLSYIYRILAEMEKDGYISKKQVKSASGPNKKIYVLCSKGLETLDQEFAKAIKTIHSRYIEYLSKLPFEKSTIQELHSLLNKRVKKEDAKILVVAPRSFYDWLVSPLCDTFKRGNIYLIKPASAKMLKPHDNLILLDTSSENILLKDGFVDFVRLHGEPENIDATLKELQRVLKKNGSLALIIPYYYSHADDQFLTIGEYVEKMEHDLSGKGKTMLDHNTAKTKLSRYFRRIEEYRLAHLSIFIAYDKV